MFLSTQAQNVPPRALHLCTAWHAITLLFNTSTSPTTRTNCPLSVYSVIKNGASGGGGLWGVLGGCWGFWLGAWGGVGLLWAVLGGRGAVLGLSWASVGAFVRARRNTSWAKQGRGVAGRANIKENMIFFARAVRSRAKRGSAQRMDR